MRTSWRWGVLCQILSVLCVTSGLLAAQPVPDDGHRASERAPSLTAADAAPTLATAFTVNLDSVNPGANVERSACVTVAIRANLAYECGDLRLTYAMRGRPLRNQSRAPSLLYNSQFARPKPIVRALVLPTGAWPGGLVSVTAILRVQKSPGAQYLVADSSTWTASQLATSLGAGQPSQLALKFNAVDLATNLYPISVEISMNFGGGNVQNSGLISSELAIVNRKGSEFGTGWWVAGYERLQRLQNGDLFWVGGDGSTRRYALLSANSSTKRYAARALTGLDSLTERVDSGTFRRHLPRGAYVHFTPGGRHDQTVSRLGEISEFRSARCTFLTDIILTPSLAQGSIGRSWIFSYDGIDGDDPCALYNPAAPSAYYERIIGIYGGTDGVWRYTFPDSGRLMNPLPNLATGPRVSYLERNGRIRLVRDAFGTETRIGWDSSGTIVADSIDTKVGGASQFIVHGFRAGEAAAVAQPIRADSAFTRLSGPRSGPDSATKMLIGAFGQPTRITTPLGHATHVSYHATFPLLATVVVAPNGHRTAADYDALGRLTTVRADGVNAPDYNELITQYTWSPASQYPDLLLTQTDPTGVVTKYEYQQFIGQYPVVTSRQTGNLSGGQTYFYYCTVDPCRGLVNAVTSAVNGANSRRSTDTYEYDAYGNLSATLTAGGKRVEYVNDNYYGRLASTRTRIATAPSARWVTDTMLYDALHRVTTTWTTADSEGPTPLQRLITIRQYVRNTNVPLVVQRYANSTLSTIGVLRDSFSYDSIGRVIANFAQGASRTVPEKVTYDVAGNVIRRVSSAGDTVAMEYDVLNRVIRRTASKVAYPADVVGSATFAPGDASRSPVFPRLPLGAQPLTVDRDSAAFTYDDDGTKTAQLRTATNRASRIARTYFPNGWVQTDTQRLSAVADTADFSQHVYGMSYVYDDAGRRRVVNHPAQLASGLSVSQEWTQYSPITGLPLWTRDLSGKAKAFEFDPSDQLTKDSAPGGVVRRLSYTLDGELDLDQVTVPTTGPAAPLPSTNGLARSALFAYDARGKMLSMANTVGLRDTLLAAYSPLGHLRLSTYATRESFAGSGPSFRSVDTVRSDALGHVLNGRKQSSSRIDGSWWFVERTGQASNWIATGTTYAPDSSGRVQASTLGFSINTNAYDAAGRLHLQQSSGEASAARVLPASERMQYYNGLGQLVAVDARRAPEPGANNLASPEYLLLFDQYRYDALGRRVLTRSRRSCPMNSASADWKECLIGSVQRTVWDGARELWEIRMPDRDDTRENDTAPLTEMIAFGYSSTFPNDTNNIDATVDLNAKSGRVAYVYGAGGGVDRPLAVHRLGYGDRPFTYAYTRLPYKMWAPFTLYPQWDFRGVPAVGSTDDGGQFPCEGPPGARRCTYALAWSGLWAVNGVSNVSGVKTAWVGSLLEDKLDATGLSYRRHRYLDGGTGTFTQPDPIGLGGGLSSYGFASGDPVNYADPFGLCDPLARGLGSLQCTLEDVIGAVRAGPRLLSGALTRLASDEFITGLASIPFTLAGGFEAEGVKVTAKGVAHVLSRHFPGGARTAGKSLFHAAESVADLARGADGAAPILQGNGNLRRVVNASREIGIDRVTNSATSTYTVITNKLHELVTMFPGIIP